MTEMNKSTVLEALQILGERLRLKQSSPIQLVVCGGSALMVLDLVSRSTEDIDVVALATPDGDILSPSPFPDDLVKAIREVAELQGLPDYWLNFGPSRDSGGLFQCGLPDGLLGRAHEKNFGSHLKVYFVDRFDQIHFKVFAAADSLGVHVADLMELKPTSEEMEAAAKWCMTHDPSEGFRMILRSMFEQLGFDDVAGNL